MDSIIDKFECRVREQPDKLLYSFLDIDGKITESYTYREFLQRVNAIAAHIQRTHKLKPGDRVLLAYPPGLEMIVSFFACVRIGLIPVPVYPPSIHGFQSALYKMTFIAKDCAAAAILTCRAYYWSMKISLTKNKISSFSFKTDHISKLKWIITDDYDADVNETASFTETRSKILFLQYTSGSTNNPKGVMVTHDNLIHNANLVVDHTPIGVSWLPQYHDMGLIGYYLFFALKGGTTYGFSPLDFIQRPALWLETISKYKGTASSAPNFAYAYCLKQGKIPEETLKSLDLSSLRFLMTAAEPVRASIFTQFIKKFEPHGLRPGSLFSAYGLAEFTLAVSNYGRKIKSFDSDDFAQSIVKLIDPKKVGKSVELVSCGKPLGDTEIIVVDVSSLKEVEPGRVGEIWIAGDSKCQGYWNKPELTEETFEAKTEGILGKTWLRSGDLGFIHDGELYVCGRTKDLIIIRGSNYYPHDVENLVEEDTAIRKGCVAAFSVDQNGEEVLVVVAELKNPKRLPDIKQLNKSLLKHLGIEAQRIVCIASRTIPKTSSGKIIRHQAKKQILDNSLKEVSVLTNQHLVVTKNRKSDPLDALFHQYHLDSKADHTLAEIGFDSMRLAEFSHDIKDYLQVNGFKELAQPIEVSLIQKIAVSKLYKILNGLRSASTPAKLQFKQAFTELQQERRHSTMLMMKTDVASLSHTIQSIGAQDTDGPSLGHILLTGGTGFFGPFLLKSLLEQRHEDIYVLVRANHQKDTMDRLREAFDKIDPSENILHEFEKRVKPISGNLARPSLGVNREEWDFLTTSIHTIYHNGASVNYLSDYEAMRDVNVLGTKEIVRLASTGRTKTLNYISTTFIFGWSVKATLFEFDNNDDMDLLDFGYSQSKWVSEKIVSHAMSQGLPVRIFRPALISPSISGDGFNFDISIRLLAFMLKHGITTSAQNQVSFTPADIVANNIVAISNLDESIGHKFHVTRNQYASMRDVTDSFAKLTGKQFQTFNLRDFVPEVLSRCTKGDLLFPLLNFLVRSIDNIKSMEFKKYENANYRRYCNLSPISIPDPSLEDVVNGILRFMQKQGIVDLFDKNENHAER